MVTFLGQISENTRMHLLQMIHMVHDTWDDLLTEKLVTFLGQIFGSNFRHMHLLYMIHIAHDTYDRHARHMKEIKIGDSFWGKL